MSLAGIIAQAAVHGRALLVAGLVAGIAAPQLALALRPWIGWMVAVMLFLAAARVGTRQAFGALRDVRGALVLALIFQVLFPVAVIAGFALAGWSGPLATGLVLMAAAPPISGSPNLAVLTGGDPAPALRQMIVGTALLGLTVFPVLLLAPALGSTGAVLGATARLIAVVMGACAAGLGVRRALFRDPGPETLRVIDGLSAMTMTVLVIGLMSAVGPAIWSRPGTLTVTLGIAFLANFGLQIGVALTLRRRVAAGVVAPLAIVAGNRNIALFLTALPASVTQPLLLFIGCYQIPMYLTPLLLGPFYRRVNASVAAAFRDRA